MAFNATNPVTVGSATKKDHYDRVFANTVLLKTSISDDGLEWQGRVRLANDIYLRGRNSAGSADVDLLRITTANELGVAASINFPEVQVPSTNTNTLDDYKERTFVPELRFGGLSTGIVYGGQSGVYVKVARNVFVTGQLFLSNKGTATGAATIVGFPLQNSEFRFINIFAFGLASGSYNIGSYISSGTPVAELFNQLTGAAVAITDANFTNTTTIYFGGWYQATD